MAELNEWQPTIGLEVHAQLLTESKLFSPEPSRFGGGDNEYTHPVSLGLPGTLPVVNARAVELATLVGLAFGCRVRQRSIFARKNYFYPDLAKGYQISQYDEPLGEGGVVEFELAGDARRIRLSRIHLEEDAGKTTHHGTYSLVNYNRAGVPLLEIVSEAEIRSAAEAAEYVRAVRRVLRYLDACDGNLEEGSLRCDCNVSVRRTAGELLGTRVEIKNINSFRFIEKAIDYEIRRQIDALERGEKILQETRLYDATKNRTFSMRTKEEAQDYRYFPEPDLLPLEISDEMLLLATRRLPELPEPRARRFVEVYGVAPGEARLVCEERAIADYFEGVARLCGDGKSAANWVVTEIFRELNDSGLKIDQARVPAAELADLIARIGRREISNSLAKQVLRRMWSENETAAEAVGALGATQVQDTSVIAEMVASVIAQHPDQVRDFRAGKEKIFGFLLGQVMKKSKGQADPDLARRLLTEGLK